MYPNYFSSQIIWTFPVPNLYTSEWICSIITLLQSCHAFWTHRNFNGILTTLLYYLDAVAEYMLLQILYHFSQNLERGGTMKHFALRCFLVMHIWLCIEGIKENLYNYPKQKHTLSIFRGSRLHCLGGPDYSCSEMAARIKILPNFFGKYQIVACNDDNIVSLNGQCMIASMGPFFIWNGDICSIGARVFVFI